jgi:hypothetical protein
VTYSGDAANAVLLDNAAQPVVVHADAECAVASGTYCEWRVNNLDVYYQWETGFEEPIRPELGHLRRRSTGRDRRAARRAWRGQVLDEQNTRACAGNRARARIARTAGVMHPPNQTIVLSSA